MSSPRLGVIGAVVAASLIGATSAGWALARSVTLRWSIEPNEDTERFRASVGRTLAGPAWLSSTLVGLALVILIPVSRSRSGRHLPWLVGLGTVLVVGGTTVATVGLVDSYRRLHPSFAAERATMDRLRPARNVQLQFTSATVAAHSELSRGWNVPGTASSVCPQLQQAFAGWADHGTVRSRPTADCAFEGRVGPRTVTVEASFVPVGYVVVIATISHD